jgi:hypothetical protein
VSRTLENCGLGRGEIGRQDQPQCKENQNIPIKAMPVHQNLFKTMVRPQSFRNYSLHTPHEKTGERKDQGWPYL